ncbi:MAG: hypothetical protein ACTSWY_06310 [Promethearchaeota archaeon]
MLSKETKEYSQKMHIRLDFRNQGKFLVGLFTIFYTYYGFICNMLMYNDFGNQIQKNAWTEGHLIIWAQEAYLRTFFLPALVLFLVCFLITVGEDIPYYGIKNAFWYIPFVIGLSLVCHWFVFGVSAEPFILLFGNYQGYLHILIVTVINLSGALLGLKVKRLVEARRLAVQKRSKFKLSNKDLTYLDFAISLPTSWLLLDLLAYIFGIKNLIFYDFVLNNVFISFIFCYIAVFILIFGFAKIIQKVSFEFK